MKRTKTTTKILQNTFTNQDNEETATRIQMIPSEEKQKLNLKSLRNWNSKDISKTDDVCNATSSKKAMNVQKQQKIQTSIENEECLKPNTRRNKGKLRAVVDLQMMKEELSQLEDPPVTLREKELSFNRLQYEFFDIPCEELAQRLLGKVLVRHLDNGIILKGRIVETEGYLGAIDKASHSYQNKVTPRNLPMYMSPGTIYVYMTYGMYYCFNISSQETNAYVLIRAVEPLAGLEYMELLRNMQRKNNGREKQIVARATHLKPYKLCNNPFKICDAFAIDQDVYDQKPAYACSSLWFENQSLIRCPTIVTKSRKIGLYDRQFFHLTIGKILGDGCAVLIRAIDPLEGIEHMIDQRNASKAARKISLKTHEVCNGPSKLCIAYQLHKQHSRYSLYTWKSLWIEDDGASLDFKIVKSTRIGIDSCGPEWASKPLRYYIYGNKSVSKRDKNAEIKISE